MTVKRYELDVRMDMPKLLIDNNTNEKYDLLMVNDIERIVDLLNEKEAEIDYLKDMMTAMKLDIKNAMQMVSRWNDE